jgi:photosystem II stability/assembly factor-like uncharacterized protein
MNPVSFRLAAGLVVLHAFSAPVRAADGAGTDPFKRLEFRNIGPALMGGRIDDFAVVESRPSTYYVAAASGGVWKTVNNGVTFNPVFDDQEVSSIGDIAVAPSDPSILYVGTGEPNNRQSSSWGNGIYKTMDGGRTWTHLGLRDTHHIGRVIIDPKNPEVVYVAALGHLWGPNKERGLFKTTDGGKTWVNTKFIDEDTGFVDVAMDPESPQTLYAASYQRRRTSFGYNGGGPGGALWRTTDGGASWVKLTKGLPTDGDIGRIGLTVYRRDPQLVYALVEHAKQGGLYRSDDKGDTWRKVSDTNPRPSYYSQIHVDPNNDQRLWVLGAPMFSSEDGGRTFRQDLVQKIHGDYHALWIDPADSNHMLAGTDGGIHVSYDRGRSWDYINTVTLAQFYEIAFDFQRPYWVCGGLQDNGSWCGPSRTLYTQGIGNEDWFRVGGGDGFHSAIDPTDPQTVYTESQDGNVSRIDLRTNERRVIRPEPAKEGERYRFNWNSPILISRHDSKTIYYGGNRLFGSKDRGDTWTLVSPDLTGNAKRDEMAVFGKAAKEFLSRNDGVVHYGTITTIAESPLKAGVLWVGTDDGHLQVSRDGGGTWTDVMGRLSGVPKGTYVSRVEASRAGDGAAYVTLDGHRNDDYRTYLFRTADFGQTWQSLASGIPGGGVHVVREDSKDANLLFAGTEFGLWASWDRGGHWQRLTGNLPTVPVDDIQIHPREDDLILATHGRGVYILDDLGVLRSFTDSTRAAAVKLLPVRGAVQYRIYAHKGNTGHKAFLAPNPPEGALVTYWLKSKPGEKEELKLVVKDGSGQAVRELKGAPREAGLNRASWDLRLEPPVRPEPGEGGGGGFGPPRGPLVPPGSYTVTLSLGPTSESQTVVVEEDPRIHISEGDRRTWYEAARQAARLWTRADAANRALQSVQRQLTALQEGRGAEGQARTEAAPAEGTATRSESRRLPEAVSTAVKSLADKVTPLAKRINRQDPLGFAGAPLAEDPEPLLPRARGLYQAISALTATPTAPQRELLARLTREADQVDADVKQMIETELPALNRQLFEAGFGRLEVPRPIS